MPFVCHEDLGIVVVTVNTEGLTAVATGLKASAVTQTAAVQGLVSILHAVKVINGLEVSESIISVEARGNGDVFITFKTTTACTTFLDTVGPVLQYNHNPIQRQLRPIAAPGAYVEVRA